MNVVLIGYRGTGKSVVGDILAKRLSMAYAAMDDQIVLRAKMSIREIVETYGWPKFRDMESDIARDLSGRDNLVIDSGGGVIERPENMKMLGQNARIFWLKASVETIVSRIQSDTQRPALVEGKTFTEEVAEVLERRMPKYKNAAHYEIDTDDLTPEQVADRIVETISRGS
jgi:shikimate kinase